VFLLNQGKNGPAIIGYGKVAGLPELESGKWRAGIQFDSLVDPTTEVLVDREDLLAINGGHRFWRTQASGVLVPESVATQLEELALGKSAKSKRRLSASNPDWTRDELILALDVYLKYRPNPPGKGSLEISELSKVLNRLGERLFPPESRADTFRNENGVYMKLMNFRRLDPQYTSEGKIGLQQGAEADQEIWGEFADDPVRCRQVAEAIRVTLDDQEVGTTDIDDSIQEAMEGRLLTRKHLARERNRQLVESKRKQALRQLGKLTCEACGFDFAIHYGNRGEGFIECHHIKPVAALSEARKTHLDDLALVCANCHRMIHRGKPWLSIAELKALVNEVRLNISVS